MKKGLLLLLVPLLHFMVLLLEHFNIVLRNVGGGGGRHNNIETRAKNVLFHLYIVDLGTITGFSDKLNRTSKAQSYRENTVICKSTHLEITSLQ